MLPRFMKEERTGQLLLVTFSLYLLLASTTIAGTRMEQETDPVMGHLKGSVRSIQLKHELVSEVNGRLTTRPTPCCVNTFTYHPEGYKLEEVRRTSAGELRSKTIITYDAKKHSAESLNYDATGPATLKVVTVYNAQGQASEKIFYRPVETLEFKDIYTYNSNGRRTEEASYDAKGTLTRKIIMTYDAKGNRIEWANYKANGSLHAKILYTYNAQGHRIKEVSLGRDGSSVLTKTYTYDGKGNKTSSTTMAPGFETLKQDYAYEFDTAGNWVKQTTCTWITKFGKTYCEPSEIAYRTITYY
jgi:hypothetical protein